MWSLLIGKFQKGACRYLLHRYLGQYLREKVTVDQLTVDLYNGTGSVTDVSLDCDALNGLAELHNLPIEFVEGSLSEITFAIPWSTIMQDSCEIQVKGLRITLQPKNRAGGHPGGGGGSMIDSMFTSMASSMQLAEECLKDIEDDIVPQEAAGELSGLEHCAKTIDAVLSRVKISFHDTILRLERCQRDSDVGVALEFHINLWEYSDDSSHDGGRDEASMGESAFSHKKITLEGLTTHMEIFSSKAHFAQGEEKEVFTTPKRRKSSSQEEEESSESDEEEEDHTPLKKESPITTVQVGKFSGAHEIKLQVKTDDSMAGPQVSADCSFGSLIALLTPLQAHILYDLINEVVDPSENLGERAFNRRSCSEKPMDSYDFKKIEKELQARAQPENIGLLPGLSQQQGWSSACYDDSDEEFQPLKGRSHNMYNSTTSNFMNASVASNTSMSSSAMMNASMSDSLNISAYKSAYNYSSSGQSGSSSGSEKTKFSFSFASVSILLLHEDILSLSSSEAVFPETLIQMQGVARHFFQTLYYFGAGVKGEKDIAEVREKMNGACDLSHHRLIAAPLKIKGMVKSSSSPSSLETSGSLVIGYFELIESLKDKGGVAPSVATPRPECIEVLTFPRNFDHGAVSQAVKLDFKTESRKGRAPYSVGSGSGGRSKTSLKFTLGECRAELDVSIVDRINSLINSPLHYYMEPKDLRNPIYRAAHPPPKSQSIIRINVKCPNFSLDFRFPIPDLRPLDDPSRVPHWIRNLHPDSILIQMRQIDFSTALASAYDGFEFDTKCHEAKLFYKSTPGDNPTLFATALADDPEIDGMSLAAQGLDWPRLLVWISPKVNPAAVAEAAADCEDNESFDTMNFMSMPKRKPSPFSSKRIVHETSSNSPEDEATPTQGSESVIPGDRTEMGEFIEDTNKSVVYRIDLNFRFVEVSLPSKHFFEEIYNRVGNDLLLWEPSCGQPNVGGVKDNSTFRSHASAAFSMCKSALRFDPDSDEEGDMTAFYSPAGQPSSKSELPVKHKETGQSELTLSLSIGKGIGSFFTQLQDASGNSIPGQKGQMSIKVEGGVLFFVSGYKGDPYQGFLCVITQKAELFHAEFLRTSDSTPRLCSELVKTIYPSEEGMMPSPPELDRSQLDMLSVAIKIDRDPAKNLKVFKVATGIRDGTLDHRIYLPNRNWFSQLTDFFDVTDMPVIGYTPSVVLTELHLHLWNCVVDYRPLHIPLRSVLAMESFSISSNIAAATSTSVLRFMAEDAALFLSSKPNPTCLREDYVAVMDMDYFELGLRICSNRASPAPRIDLSATSNALHIRTCSDSFKALLELLTYYANDGDLYDPSVQRDSDSVGGGASGSAQFPGPSSSSPIKENRRNYGSEPALISTTEELLAERLGERNLSASHLEAVGDLVAEAMLESEFGSRRQQPSRGMPAPMKPQQMYDLHFTDDSVDVFGGGGDPFQCRDEDNFFPYAPEEEESTTPLPSSHYPNLNNLHSLPIMETSISGALNIVGSDEDEEEFCILDNDPGVGIIRRNGEPEAQARVLDESIRLIENHFAPPVGKMDALKAPKHYPSPVAKYSLKEMTVVWHLYGGDDFGGTPSRKSSGKSDERGSSETVYSDSWKEQTNPGMFYCEPSEVDLAVDALNPGVVFSKTKAFESAWEAYESPKNPRKHLPDGCNSWRQQGGKGRRHDTLVELHLNKIKLVHEIYPDSTEQASRQVMLINTVEILDKLRSSQFNKFLYLYTTPNRPKQTHAHMIMIKAAHLRPDPQLAIEECCLKISLLPVRLNIDQDALLFLYQYFSDLSVRPDSEDDDSTSGRLTNPPSHTPSVESLPVMTVNVGEIGGGDFTGTGAVNMQEGLEGDGSSNNLLLFNEDPFGMDETASTCSKDPSIDSAKSSTPVYFRQIIFAPEVPIRLDYRGKRVDMTHGPLAGLLMGLAQLNCSEIRLKQIYHRHGILGFDRLIAFLINEWATDIKKNQLPSLLGGVGPIHSFVQLFQGMRDLIWFPIEQYQKDGRIAKGLQRGVNAFSTSTAMAALELTNKLIQTIQGAAELAFDMVSPGPSVQQKRRQGPSKRRKRRTQPGDIREGMTNAYNVVREGLGDTATTIVRVASREHEQKGISGAVGGVLRQIPPTVVRPIILVAEATSNVLDGFRSQLEPDFKKENEEKWKET